jgi:hypothetical protein
VARARHARLMGHTGSRAGEKRERAGERGRRGWAGFGPAGGGGGRFPFSFSISNSISLIPFSLKKSPNFLGAKIKYSM